MKSNIHFIVALTALLLAGGCSSNNEPVAFLSEPQVPSFSSDAPAMRLTRDDDKKILLAVYSNLLERQLGNAGDCPALFLQADDEMVEALMKKYPAHVPPIKPSRHIDLSSKQHPLDKETGKPAMILAADIGMPKADGVVEVVGRWYAGEIVRGTYVFAMKKTGDGWIIAAVK
jgi:hypothetical protein